MSVYRINGATLALAQVESLTRTDVSLSVDKLRISEPLELTGSSAPYAYGDAVVITKDGSRWFAGRVNSLPRTLRGGSKAIAFEVVGPWWWVENVVYQVAVPTGPSDDVENKKKGRIDIASGATATSVISAALSYAASRSGGAFQAGSVSVPIILPADQLRDVTCADIIKSCLRLAPDATSSVDYTTTPPTISIRSSSSGTVSLPVTALTSLEIGPRPDLKIPGVQIIYEIAKSVDGETHTDVVLDEAGDTNDARCMVLTIPVTGPATTYLKQKVRVETIRDEPVDDGFEDTFAFLLSHAPWLSRCRLDGGTFKIGNGLAGATEASVDNHPAPIRKLANPAPGSEGAYELEDPADPDSDHVELDTDLSKELVEGAITEWMTGVKGQAQDIIFWIKYQINEKGTEADPIWEQVGWQQLWVHVLATNALSRTYTGIDSYEGGDEVPEGVADAYYETVSVIPYSGSGEIEEAEISRNLHPGLNLQITGGRSEWLTMSARIQSVTYELKSRKTAFTFGPPEQLAPQNFGERMKALRPGQYGRVPYGDRGVPGLDEYTLPEEDA